MKKSRFQDGWHFLKGHKVYIKSGKIQYGVVCDRYSGERKAVLCRKSGTTWMASEPVTVDAFYSGIRRGTIRFR